MSRLSFLLAVLVLLAFLPADAVCQVSTSLGGDLSGKPSSATVVKLRGRTLGTTAPVSGDAYVFNGTEWTPQPNDVGGGGGGGGGGGSGDRVLCLDTITTTSTAFIGTANVTMCTITVPAARWERGDFVSIVFYHTLSATVSTAFTPWAYHYPSGGMSTGSPFSGTTGVRRASQFALSRWHYSGDPSALFARGGFGSNINIGQPGAPGSFTGPVLFHNPYGPLPCPPGGADFHIDVGAVAANNNPGNVAIFDGAVAWSMVVDP